MPRPIDLHTDNPVYELIAARLRAARLKAGWTISQLARETNLGALDIGRMEANKQEIRIGYVHRIARALGVKMADLLDAEEQLGVIMPPGEEPWAWRITDRVEQALLTSWRALMRKEKKTVFFLMEALVKARDRGAEEQRERRRLLRETLRVKKTDEVLTPDQALGLEMLETDERA